MANVVVTMKIMPESPEVSFSWLTQQAEPMIAAYGTVMKTERQPIAFGLSALIFTFLMNEAKGDTEKLEKQVASIKGVIHVEVIDVRRAVG
jgi:elongation factor 1-beta